MSGFAGSPHLFKGALVVFESSRGWVPTNIIEFQYNPDSVSRSLAAETADDSSVAWARSGASRNVLPPTERLTMTVELDATDDLERGAAVTGLHPDLAALELLLHPGSREVIQSKALALFGSAYIRPAQAPLVLLEWGALRVVPVRVESMSITEQAFDPLLNPIRASVELGLRTLSEAELQEAGRLFEAADLVNLIAKEALAHARPPIAIASFLAEHF
jgi:Contractile injection system tube protein